MRSHAKDNSRQLTLPFNAMIVPQGDGSMLLRPGKPLHQLSPQQFASALGVSRASVYRRIEDGSIPQQFVHYRGPRLIRIDAEALRVFEVHWKKQRAEQN